MSVALDPQNVPLVVVHGQRFMLSHQLIESFGPFIGGWEMKKFVCHIISHFDDGLEHLLDDEVGQEGDPNIFDIDVRRCEYLAKEYSRDFPGLSAEWYYQLFRAKLLCTTVPHRLVRQYKYAQMAKGYDLRRFIRAALVVHTSKVGNMGEMAGGLGDSDCQTWESVMDLVEPWIKSGLLTDEEILLVYDDCL